MLHGPSMLRMVTEDPQPWDSVRSLTSSEPRSARRNRFLDCTVARQARSQRLPVPSPRSEQGGSLQSSDSLGTGPCCLPRALQGKPVLLRLEEWTDHACILLSAFDIRMSHRCTNTREQVGSVRILILHRVTRDCTGVSDPSHLLFIGRAQVCPNAPHPRIGGKDGVSRSEFWFSKEHLRTVAWCSQLIFGFVHCLFKPLVGLVCECPAA